MACLGMAVAEEAGACTDNIPSAVSSAFRHIDSQLHVHTQFGLHVCAHHCASAADASTQPQMTRSDSMLSRLLSLSLSVRGAALTALWSLLVVLHFAAWTQQVCMSSLAAPSPAVHRMSPHHRRRPHHPAPRPIFQFAGQIWMFHTGTGTVAVLPVRRRGIIALPRY